MVRKRRGALIKWSGLLLVVTLLAGLLSEIDEKVPMLGSVLNGIALLAWDVVSFFAFPAVAIHDSPVFASIKEAGESMKAVIRKMKRRYGGLKFFAAVAGVGLAWLALCLLVLIAFIYGFGGLVVVLASLGINQVVLQAVPWVLAIALLCAIIYLSALANAYMAVWHAAVYRFSVHGDVVGGFTKSQLEEAFVPRR